MSAAIPIAQQAPTTPPRTTTVSGLNDSGFHESTWKGKVPDAPSSPTRTAPRANTTSLKPSVTTDSESESEPESESENKDENPEQLPPIVESEETGPATPKPSSKPKRKMTRKDLAEMNQALMSLISPHGDPFYESINQSLAELLKIDSELVPSNADPKISDEKREAMLKMNLQWIRYFRGSDFADMYSAPVSAEHKMSLVASRLGRLMTEVNYSKSRINRAYREIDLLRSLLERANENVAIGKELMVSISEIYEIPLAEIDLEKVQIIMNPKEKASEKSESSKGKEKEVVGETGGESQEEKVEKNEGDEDEDEGSGSGSDESDSAATVKD